MAWQNARKPASGGVSANALLLLIMCLGITLALAGMEDPPVWLTFVFILAWWIQSVVVHEFGHAVVAYRAGDHTVAEKGYLSLDPFKYTDLTTSIIFPLLFLAMGGIGFPGGAVYLREDLMRSKLGRSLSSLAGPMGTLLVLVAVAGVINFAGPNMPDQLRYATAFLAYLQATALILNLLPVPGLDGYGVIRPWLPVEIRRAIQPVEQFAIFGLLIVFLLVPGASSFLYNYAADLMNLVGVSLFDVREGLLAFRFWEQG